MRLQPVSNGKSDQASYRHALGTGRTNQRWAVIAQLSAQALAPSRRVREQVVGRWGPDQAVHVTPEANLAVLCVDVTLGSTAVDEVITSPFGQAPNIEKAQQSRQSPQQQRHLEWRSRGHLRLLADQPFPHTHAE